MPPRKKNDTVSLADAVLNGADTSADQTAADQPTTADAAAPALTPEQLEIQALKDALAAEKARAVQERTHPVDSLGRPLSDSELTPEQLQIRQLQDQVARQKGRGDVIEEVFEDGDEVVLIHFLEDGVTSNGRTFYRGQEVRFGKSAFEDTKNRFGESWLDMSDEEQFDRWGSVKFHKGPWPGKRKYEESEAQNVSITSQVPATRI